MFFPEHEIAVINPSRALRNPSARSIAANAAASTCLVPELAPLTATLPLLDLQWTVSLSGSLNT
jgi:hypothetical protein